MKQVTAVVVLVAEMLALVFVALVFALMLLNLGKALAHDYARPELAPWFMSLHSRTGSPCCDGSDATHLSDVEWRTARGADGQSHYQVMLEGAWRDVPDSAVVDGPNRDGPALVWPYYLNGQMIGVRCFMPGAGT